MKTVFAILLALSAFGVSENLKAKSAIKVKSEPSCSKVWSDGDVSLEAQSLFETITFSRKARTITRRVHDWAQKKTKSLNQNEFENLDGFLRGLCLELVRGEAVPPPGDPARVTVKGRSRAKRLGWKGNTGGDYFLLKPEELETLFEKLHHYGPK